jgi:hypothetical protein
MLSKSSKRCCWLIHTRLLRAREAKVQVEKDKVKAREKALKKARKKIKNTIGSFYFNLGSLC